MFGYETYLVTPSQYLRVFGMPRKPRKEEKLENVGEPKASEALEFLERHFGN